MEPILKLEIGNQPFTACMESPRILLIIISNIRFSIIHSSLDIDVGKQYNNIMMQSSRVEFCHGGGVHVGSPTPNDS